MRTIVIVDKRAVLNDGKTKTQISLQAAKRIQSVLRKKAGVKK